MSNSKKPLGYKKPVFVAVTSDEGRCLGNYGKCPDHKRLDCNICAECAEYTLLKGRELIRRAYKEVDNTIAIEKPDWL